MPSLYGLKKAGAATSRLFVAALKLYVTFVHLLLGQADHSGEESEGAEWNMLCATTLEEMLGNDKNTKLRQSSSRNAG